MDKGSQVLRRSCIDRFNRWVDRLPVRSWVFYAAFGLALILVQILFLWLDSGPFASELLPVIAFNGLAVPYLLALIRLLDRQALHSLENMRPVLSMPADEFEAYRIRIANMPFLAPLAAGLAMTVFTILFPMVAIEPERYAVLEQLPLFTVAYQIIDKASAFLFGVAVYHTVRQLRLVYTINAKYIRINIFRLRPVQSFSRLTGATALGLVIFFYGWLFINPELLADPATLGVSLLFTVLAVLIFAGPLWGVHTLMVAQKEQALREIELQFEGLFAEFNQHVAKGDYAAVEKLNGTVMSLEIQHNKVSAIPTWPWRTETAQVVLTAVAVPVLLMIVQYFVLQVIE